MGMTMAKVTDPMIMRMSTTMDTSMDTSMDRVTRTDMEARSLLTLTQWLSPGFPVSAYAYSHGLEQVIDAGGIGDAATLAFWLEDVLADGAGRNDAILLAAAYRAEAEALPEIDAMARAFAASAERLTETVDQGAAFARTVNDIWDTDIPALCYPVAVGRAARLRDLPRDATVAVYLHAFAASLVSAAVRLVPLGQTEGQRVLAGLCSTVTAVTREALDAGLDDLASSCLALDIAAMHHETQYSKVFRT
jgi:urease accessory protein